MSVIMSLKISDTNIAFVLHVKILFKYLQDKLSLFLLRKDNLSSCFQNMLRQNLNANTKHKLKNTNMKFLILFILRLYIINKVYVKTFKMVVSFEKAHYYDNEIIKKKQLIS